jgi:ankyrin repeat protein
MHMACSLGNLPLLKYLSSQGAKLNLREQETHYTCVHVAAIAGHVDIVQFLLQNPATSVGKCINPVMHGV